MEQLNDILAAHVASSSDTKDKLLGAAFTVVSKDGTLFAGSAGRIDVDPSSARFTGGSFTGVASLTKLVTTTCIMQLVERQVLSLDADVRGVVPELAAMQILRGFDDADEPILEDNTRPITLRMLLTHTVGLGYDLADPDLMKWSAKVGRTATNLDWTRAGFNTPLKFAPGDGWYYGTAVDWAGLVLEATTKQTLGEYMQKHIFDPLGMRDTGFWPERMPQTASRTVVFSYRNKDKASLEAGPSPVAKDRDVESGGAGLFTTADDYARFQQALLGGKLVSGATLDLMFTPQLNDAQRSMLEQISYHSGVQDGFAPEFPTGLPLNHGIGGITNMEDVPGKRRKGSLMWSGMFCSRWWMDRTSGIAAALVVNVQPHGDAVVKHLYDELERAVYAQLVRKE